MMFLRFWALRFLIFGFFVIFFNFWSVDRFHLRWAPLNCGCRPPTPPNRQNFLKNKKINIFCISRKKLSQIGSLDNSHNSFYETADFWRFLTLAVSNSVRTCNKIDQKSTHHQNCPKLPRLALGNVSGCAAIAFRPKSASDGRSPTVKCLGGRF